MSSSASKPSNFSLIEEFRVCVDAFSVKFKSSRFKYLANAVRNQSYKKYTPRGFGGFGSFQFPCPHHTYSAFVSTNESQIVGLISINSLTFELCDNSPLKWFFVLYLCQILLVAPTNLGHQLRWPGRHSIPF